MSQVQPKSGCLRGLKTNEPKNCPTVNRWAGFSVETAVLAGRATNSTERIEAMAAGHDEAREVVGEEVHEEAAARGCRGASSCR